MRTVNNAKEAKAAGTDRAARLFAQFAADDRFKVPLNPPVTDWFHRPAERMPLMLNRIAVDAANEEWARLHKIWRRRRRRRLAWKYGAPAAVILSLVLSAFELYRSFHVR